MAARTSARVDPRLNHYEKRIWEIVSTAPVDNLWRPHGISAWAIARRVWTAMLDDRLFGHAAELGFYFLFALFPSLVCASAILGLVARSGHQVYYSLLHYVAVVVPPTAAGAVLRTFQQASAASTSGKLTFSMAFAVWSASVGVSALQDTLNAVYKLVDRRSYLRARLEAIVLTMGLIVTVSLCLGCLFGGNAMAEWARSGVADPGMRDIAEGVVRVLGWALAAGFLTLSFTITYHWAPDLSQRRWRWLTPGEAVGLLGWLLASIGLRIYLDFFNSYSVTYGSLGAVIILLTWLYITGLMLLIGAEIDSEIEASVVERKMAEQPAGPGKMFPAA